MNSFFSKCARLAAAACALLLVSSSAALSMITYSSDGNYAVVTGTNATQVNWYVAANDVTTSLGSGWHLATITSQSEQNNITNLISSVGGNEFWLGAYQNPIDTLDPNANWTWITGELWNYTNWGYSGWSGSGWEPNDGFGPGTEQYLGITLGGGWNDEGNYSNISGYVAERDSLPVIIPPGPPIGVPESSTFMLIGVGVASVVLSRIFAKVAIK